MKKISLKRLLVFGILIIVAISSSTCFGRCDETTPEQIDDIEIQSDKDIIAVHYGDTTLTDEQKAINRKNRVKADLVKEVTVYVNKRASAAHHTIPSTLVEMCLEHNIDICFVMSQTELETNFGTLGAGRSSSRKSLFGVAVKRYSDYYTAIYDYARILKKSYLTKGRTEQHLMNKYTTTGGARYAANPNYEAELRSTYNKIKKQTSIYQLQQQYLTM